MALGGYPENAHPEDVLAAARRAARRAGMTLGEWLDAEARRQQTTDHYEPSIDDLHGRLEEMERAERPSRSRHANAEESASDLVRRIEERLTAISRRMESRQPGTQPVTQPRFQTHQEPEPAEHRPSAPASAWREPRRPERGNRDSHIGGEPISDLKSAIAEIASRQSALENGFDTAVSSYADRVDHRIDTMAERLERRMDGGSSAAAIRDLEAEVRAIAARLDRDRSSPATDLREEMVDLVHRLDELPARLADDIAPRLEDTARRLDTATRAELDAIRAEMREIAQDMDRGSKAQFEALRGDISNLTEQFSASVSGRAGGEVHLAEADRSQISEMREEIRALTSRFDGTSRDDFAALREDLRLLSERVDTVPNERLRDLDKHLSTLAERLEGAPAAEGGIQVAGLAEIERRIADLAEKLDGSTSRPQDLSGIDEQLGELLRRMEEDRSSAELLKGLKDEFVELRDKMASAEERSQGTLSAVNETLAKIVDRLTDLEGEVEEASERRFKAQPAPGGEPDIEEELDADDLVGRIEAVTRSFEREPDDNTPLMPGSGRPASVEREEEGEPDTAPDPKDDRASFIAAARRAAQAASAETDITPKAKLSDRMSPSAANGKLGPLAKHKRVLLIGAAMAGLVIASMMLARHLGSQTETSSLDAAPAAVESSQAPQTETPAATAEETAPTQQPRVVTTAPAQEPEAEAEPSAQDAPPAGAAEQDAPLTTGSISPAAEPEEKVQQVEMPPEAVGSEKLRMAAAMGDAAAQYEVGARYTDGQGVAQDFERAAYWYRLAAAQGLAPAQYRLGSLYEKGNGASRDLAMARMWYTRAAEQGHRTAMHNLAVLHADGIGGKPNYEEAAMWFRQASEFGLRDSQYNLAVLYARGLGVERDYAESYRWFSLAADQGDSEAAAKRDEISGQMDETALSEVRLALESWQPKPLIEEANRVSAPEGGWADAEPASAAVEPAEMARTAQSLLGALGYEPGPADGQVGERTREAIRQFERQTGLPETGQVTPELIEELNRAAG